MSPYTPFVCTRATAVEQGRTRYFTGEACSYGHVAERLVSNWACVQCRHLSRQPGGSQHEARVAARKHWKKKSRFTDRVERALERKNGAVSHG